MSSDVLPHAPSPLYVKAQSVVSDRCLSSSAAGCPFSRLRPCVATHVSTPDRQPWQPVGDYQTHSKTSLRCTVFDPPQRGMAGVEFSRDGSTRREVCVRRAAINTWNGLVRFGGGLDLSENCWNLQEGRVRTPRCRRGDRQAVGAVRPGVRGGRRGAGKEREDCFARSRRELRDLPSRFGSGTTGAQRGTGEVRYEGGISTVERAIGRNLRRGQPR